MYFIANPWDYAMIKKLQLQNDTKVSYCSHKVIKVGLNTNGD